MRLLLRICFLADFQINWISAPTDLKTVLKATTTKAAVRCRSLPDNKTVAYLNLLLSGRTPYC
jgi:hypothetical protein